jgi:hypothetical protein
MLQLPPKVAVSLAFTSMRASLMLSLLKASIYTDELDSCQKLLTTFLPHPQARECSSLLWLAIASVGLPRHDVFLFNHSQTLYSHLIKMPSSGSLARMNVYFHSFDCMLHFVPLFSFSLMVLDIGKNVVLLHFKNVE